MAPARLVRSTSHSRQRSGSACTTSMGRRLRAVCVGPRGRRLGPAPARPAPRRFRARARWPDSSPTSPAQHIPAPPVARPGLPATTVRGRAAPARDHGGNALEQDRPRRFPRRPPSAARPGIELACGRERREQGAELAGMRGEDQGASSGKQRQAPRRRPRRPPARRRRAPPRGQPPTRAVMSLRRPGSRPSPGPMTTESARAISSRSAAGRRLIETMSEGLDIRLGLGERGDRIRRRHRVHQTRSRAERRARGHSYGSAHPGIAADHHHPAPVALVIPGPEAGASTARPEGR